MTVTTNGSRNRQSAFRKRMEARGMIQITGWINYHQAAAVQQLLRRLKENGDLTVGPVRNQTTGQLEKLEL